MIVTAPGLGSKPGRALASAAVRYPAETFTPEERQRLAAHFTDLDAPVFALVNLPETVKGALFARYSRYPGTLRRLFLDEFADSLPEPGRALGRRRGQARERALRAHLRRLRRRLRRPARRRAHRGGVVLERPDEAAPAPAPGRLPRAVHALHRLRRGDAGRWLSLLPRRRARARVRRRDGRALRRLRAGAPARDRLGRPGVPARRGRARGRLAAGDQGQGARPAARPAARLIALAHGHLRHRPDLRAADPAPARASAARGARVRAHDPHRRRSGDAELRRARRPARPRRRVGRLPRGPRARRRPLGGPPGSRPRTRGGRARTLRAAAARRRRRGVAAGGAASSRPAGSPSATPAWRWLLSASTSARRCSASWSASGPTAATGPAAGSRRCATASRSSPTTAPSATSSATAC